MTWMFVNLPVTDLDRAKAFYTALGFTINPMFTDHNAACVVVEDDHSAFMLLTRDYFQTFTDLPLGDNKVSPAVSTAAAKPASGEMQGLALTSSTHGRPAASTRKSTRA